MLPSPCDGWRENEEKYDNGLKSPHVGISQNRGKMHDIDLFLLLFFSSCGDGYIQGVGRDGVFSG